jgi:[ribosomal protein S18]-alanine N-acetyltransferase
MKNFNISFARDEERNRIAEILANSEPWITLGVTLDQSLKTCNDREYLIFVARIKDVPIGAIVAHRRGVASSPYLKSVVVVKEFRSIGVGAAMMKYVEKYFKKESKHLFLCVSSFNKGAQEFYKRIGFEKTGEFKDYVIDGASEFLFYKRLK